MDGATIGRRFVAVSPPLLTFGILLPHFVAQFGGHSQLGRVHVSIAVLQFAKQLRGDEFIEEFRDHIAARHRY